MCFSAEADVAGAVVAGAIGFDALRHTEGKSELALASLPLLFGAHQLTEAFVWWGQTDRVSSSVGGTAAWIYLAFAFAVLPVLVPLAVRAVEPDARRRNLMVPFAALGLVVAAVYLFALVANPVNVQIDGHRLVYSNHVDDGWAVDALYVLATCVPLLASSHRRILVFGVVNVAVLAALIWMDSNARTSLWCAWAALTSAAIAAHLRFAHQGLERHGAMHGHPA